MDEVALVLVGDPAWATRLALCDLVFSGQALQLTKPGEENNES